MGLWSKVGGAAMIVGGVALAGPTGGASLAMIPAGAGVLSADAKKEAAKKAGAQLETASNKAIATLETARRGSEAAYAPYTQTGANAVSALNDFMGLPSIAPSSSAQGPLASGFTGGIGAAGSPGSRTPSPTAEMTGRVGVPRDAELMPTPGTPEMRAAQQTASGYTPLGGVGAGGFVQMRAPTGQTSWVPRQQAPFYAQRGAVEVS